MARKAVIGSLLVLLAQLASAQITFIIESLPSGTPGTDTIFVTGNFNNWIPNDPRYAVQWQPSGQLAVTLPESTGRLEYKFTRGSWTKVETNEENKYTDNRTYTPGSSKKIYVRIDNWLDLGGARNLNYVVFYFFACAFQGVALSLIAYRIHKKDDLKFKPLMVLNSVLTFLLVVLILKETLNQVWQSYFVFLFHVSFYCLGPLLLFFISSFHTGKPFPKIRLYFSPAVVALAFVVMRILNVLPSDFLSTWLRPPLTLANTLLIGIALAFNAWMFIRIYQHFSFLRLNPPGTNRNRMLYYFFWTCVLTLLLIPVNMIFIMSGLHSYFVSNFHGIAIILSALIFIETYFLWRYPEIIKEDRVYATPTEDSQNWMERVNAFMNDNKPYKNADLSVSDLAEMLGTKPHVLSKIINDSYHKNFRDFVNTYRIEEFIRLAHTKEFKRYTFLALAQEVGFNSKSTFNLAFKKLTNQSPREYFKSKEVM